VLTWLPNAQALSVADVIRLTSNDHGSPANNAAQVDNQQVLALAQTILHDLKAARAREGDRLSVMLQERLVKLRELAGQAVPLVPQLVTQHQQRFLTRWKEALNLTSTQGNDSAASSIPVQAAQDRALSEATAFAIRIDVTEEISRLGAHLDELERLLKTGGELGKRLDFLIQELHREANTLGSKSATLELTRISVDMKVLIEQMREQVQNIE
jgi:uncharacterized protein (TIGR00255 family)